MSRNSSKRFVIDASVYLSAGGEDASHPSSKRCRDFLKNVLTVCHKVVMVPSLQAELRKVPTRKKKGRRMLAATMKWLTQMNGRKKVCYLLDNPDRSLRDKLEKAAQSANDRRHMLDDVYLIEAALTTDGIVASCDKHARGLFAAAASQKGLRQLKAIIWVNPDSKEEHPLPWLKEGAPPQQERTLGHTHEEITGRRKETPRK